MKKMISMIINCHCEGILAHASMRCFQAIREYTEQYGFVVEWVIVIDKGDAETKKVVTDSLFLRDQDQVHEVTFGDLGLSRNHGASRANGRYIGFFDADDFYSRNWLLESYVLAEKLNGRFIFHPGYAIFFERENRIIKWYDQADLACPSVYTLLKQNLWPSSVFLDKKIVEEIPYVCAKAGSGFGYEDWHWNCETIASGYQHKIVPTTILFYRQKKQGSLCVEHTQSYALIHPSKLFNQLRDE